MENSGLYFIGRCTSPNCAYFNRLTTLYIGKGQTFDFVKERRKCMCGSCFSPMTEMLHVLFFNCRWSYRGMLLNGERRYSLQEQRTSSYEYFPGELQELPWKWLKFSIGEESGGRKVIPQNVQTQIVEQAKNSAAVQTEEDSRTSNEARVIDEEAIDMLLVREKTYHQKYRTLKRRLLVKQR